MWCAVASRNLNEEKGAYVFLTAYFVLSVCCTYNFTILFRNQVIRCTIHKLSYQVFAQAVKFSLSLSWK